MTEGILVLLYTLLFVILVRRFSFFRMEGMSRNAMVLAFLVKVAAGLLLGYIYTYHYTDRLKSDTLKFFDDSKVIFDLLKTRPGDFLRIFTGIGADRPSLTPTYMQLNSWMYEEFMNSNRTMIRIDILFRFLVPGNFYFVHVVFINFLSFSGLVYLGKILNRFTRLDRRLVYGLVFFIPSLLFWGSGLLKESILLLALGAFLYHYFFFLEGSGNFRHLLPLLLSGLLLVFIKLYIPLVLGPPLFAYYWVMRSPRRVILKYVACCMAFFLFLFHVNLVFPRYNLNHYLYIKQRDFLALVSTEKPASAIAIPVLEPSFSSIAKNLPRGFVTTLTRPWLLESTSPFILLAGAENLLVILTISACAFFFRRPGGNLNFLAFSLCIVVILYTLVGLVTPIEGAIVRYKCVALPFLFAALLSMTDLEKLKTKLRLRHA